MRKQVIFIAVLLLSISLCSDALAADIGANMSYYRSDYEANWADMVNGTRHDYPGFEEGPHPQGAWNSPYSYGVESFGYNDPQDYTKIENQIIGGGSGSESKNTVVGPHGGYLTTSHKCRECHSLHEAAGTYKLTRASERYQTCDWCHGFGAGSGFNIETDNDPQYSAEYNNGHTVGFGIETGKWKAPGDTYPAYTPVYWQGGFSCFDCHSPHANPQRTLGFSTDGMRRYMIFNQSYGNMSTSLGTGSKAKYPAGSWILLKDPDREVRPGTTTRIEDMDTDMTFDVLWNGGTEKVAVNKLKIDWDKPTVPGDGQASGGIADDSFDINEFCADCHDGNAGLSSQRIAKFSEERAMHGSVGLDAYQISSSHDSNQRLMGVKMLFDPQDGKNYGPSCRTCHRASSDCSICHSEPGGLGDVEWPRLSGALLKGPRESNVSYPSKWRTSPASVDVSAACSNDGFDFPHRTLSWKMLKDSLFGVDFDGKTPVGPGETRHSPNGSGSAVGSSAASVDALEPTHDLDSVCLDCHNPTIWNPENKGELVTRGLP